MKMLKNELNYKLPIRTEKDFPIPNIEFIDLMPLFIDKNIFKDMIDLFTENLNDKNIDYIVGPEARGFILASALALNCNTGFIPVRKHGKLPPTTIELEFEYTKEYGKDILCLPKLVNNETYKNKNFYIIDDIYATGNTIQSIKNAITSLGGNVKGIGVVMNITELNNDSKTIYSILDVNED